MPQYLERNTCKVCGVQFLNLNITNIMSHIGIDHKVLSLLLEELELNDIGNSLNNVEDEFCLADDDSTNKQVDDLPSMSIEEIQKLLLPYQNDLDEAVSGGTSTNEMMDEDDEIVEVSVPPKPEAPLIDLELEEDDDSTLISIIDENKTSFDNGSELNLVGGLADICEVLFK